MEWWEWGDGGEGVGCRVRGGDGNAVGVVVVVMWLVEMVVAKCGGDASPTLLLVMVIVMVSSFS